MKIFKKIDAYLQLVLIPVCLCTIFYVHLSNAGSFGFLSEDEVFFGSYFLVGGIQVTSCLLNLFFVDKQYKSPKRRIYHITLLAIAACCLLLNLLALFGLLFISPIIAFLYCYMCFSELKLFNHEKA